jgi:hypothetical protein
MALAEKGGKSGTGPKTGERRGRGFGSPAETARRRLGRAAERYGFAEPEVLLHWSEVVGERLAGLCAPVKVSYPRDHSLSATLLVRAEGARAPEIDHLGPRIVERVNQFYGYRAIGRVKVTQTTGPSGLAEAPARFAGLRDEAAAPDAAALARAAEMTRGIENQELRAALTRMGAHVLARRRSERD